MFIAYGNKIKKIHRAAVPLHGIYGRNPIVSSNSVQVSVHGDHAHSTAGAAQGCYIRTPAVCVWVVPAGGGGRGVRVCAPRKTSSWLPISLPMITRSVTDAVFVLEMSQVVTDVHLFIFF